MTTQCFNVVRGRRVRITQLDTCGIPVSGGAGAFVVSSGFIQVTLAPDTEKGDEYVQKNANGDLCVNERAQDMLKRLAVTIDWCQVDPDIINLITGFPLETSGLNTVGFRIQEGRFNTRWALELWVGLGDEDCSTSGYGYVLVPRITGATLGDVKVENSVVSFQTAGYTEKNPGWGVGPFNVIGSPATPLTVPMGATQHALIRTTTVAPPAAACGRQVL